MMLKVGVIGVGRIGRCHLESLTTMPGVRVTMVADIIDEAARSACNDFGVPTSTRDWLELVRSPDVEAVIICSPTDQHADQIKECARLRKYIFCEKPISLDLHTIDEVVRVVEENNAFCMVAFQRRFDMSFMRVRQAVVNGEVGNVAMVHIVSRDPSPPPLNYIAVSGGLHNDMAIHDFDMAHFLVGEEIVEVFTYGSCRVDPAIGQVGDIDTSLVMLKFANGAVATIDNCRKATYGYDQRVEVFGSNGMAQSDNRFHNTCVISDGTSVHKDRPMNFFMDRYRDAYRAEMKAFIDAIKTGSRPPCGVEEGRAAARIAVAAKKSMEAGKPIRLDEI
jgi:myo-inositol 2-dehydrogenase/D-chiro-inositol 1-dehydrogenase